MLCCLVFLGTVLLIAGSSLTVPCATSYLWFRDDPAVHTGTNLAERSLITADGDSTRKSGSPDLQALGPIPWANVFRNKNVCS